MNLAKGCNPRASANESMREPDEALRRGGGNLSETAGGGVYSTLLAAVALPIGLLLTLLIARGTIYAVQKARDRKPIPITIAPYSAESKESENWIRFRSELQEFISYDPGLARMLFAPGISSSSSPSVTSATPAEPGSGWNSMLSTIVLGGARPTYEVHITPLRDSERSSVGLDVVKKPQGQIVRSCTLEADGPGRLVRKAGVFSIECAMSYPGTVRRTPRWELWPRTGGYEVYRMALEHQRLNELDAARTCLEGAGYLAVGNARLPLCLAAIYEQLEDYPSAIELYNAVLCMWPRNIEIMYRLAAAQMNVSRQSIKPADQRIIQSAGSNLERARISLQWRYILTRFLRTWLPTHRDLGERSYWASWMKADRFRPSLILLRRSKRHEYLKAVEISIRANTVLKKGATTEELRKAYDYVTGEVRKERIGWLAHWTAACFYSRLCDHDLGDWKTDWDARRRPHPGLASRPQDGVGSISLGNAAQEKEPTDWKSYCEIIAVGEIGRVLRNPCNQLNVQLLRTDPDMRPLKETFKGSEVQVLMGRSFWEQGQV